MCSTRIEPPNGGRRATARDHAASSSQHRGARGRWPGVAVVVFALGVAAWLLQAAPCAAAPLPRASGQAVAVVDRIEGDIAVLVGEDGQVYDVPLAWLQQGAREGDVLARGLRVDRRDTERRRVKARALLDKLMGRMAAGTAAGPRATAEDRLGRLRI
jgi:hypothetical protein